MPLISATSSRIVISIGEAPAHANYQRLMPQSTFPERIDAAYPRAELTCTQ